MLIIWFVVAKPGTACAHVLTVKVLPAATLVEPDGDIVSTQFGTNTVVFTSLEREVMVPPDHVAVAVARLSMFAPPGNGSCVTLTVMLAEAPTAKEVEVGVHVNVLVWVLTAQLPPVADTKEAPSGNVSVNCSAVIVPVGARFSSVNV